eukprot:896662_1
MSVGLVDDSVKSESPGASDVFFRMPDVPEEGHPNSFEERTDDDRDRQIEQLKKKVIRQAEYNDELERKLRSQSQSTESSVNIEQARNKSLRTMNCCIKDKKLNKKTLGVVGLIVLVILIVIIAISVSNNVSKETALQTDTLQPTWHPSAMPTPEPTWRPSARPTPKPTASHVPSPTRPPIYAQADPSLPMEHCTRYNAYCVTYRGNGSTYSQYLGYISGKYKYEGLKEGCKYFVNTEHSSDMYLHWDGAYSYGWVISRGSKGNQWAANSYTYCNMNDGADGSVDFDFNCGEWLIRTDSEMYSAPSTISINPCDSAFRISTITIAMYIICFNMFLQ